jgi:hypothetical protein
LVRKIQYCSGIDLSRPRFALIRAISSSVDIGPLKSRVGSPEARTKIKINIEIPIRAINACINLTMMKRVIGYFPYWLE